MDIGGFLSQARQARGLTLQQISQQTKVPPAVLEHIEHNRFGRLPGGVFTKGYLRAFAASVGVNGEQVVQEYVLQSAPPPPAPVAPAPVVRRELSLRVPIRVPVPIQIAGLSLLALAIGGYLIRDIGRRTVDTASAVTETPVPVATTGNTSPPRPPTPPVFTWPAQMDMEVSANCWVAATVDGEKAVYRLVRRGERISVTINNEVRLRVGDPNVFTYKLNGMAGRPLGKTGGPATVRITRDTYRDFLQSPPDATTSSGVS